MLHASRVSFARIKSNTIPELEMKIIIGIIAPCLQIKLNVMLSAIACPIDGDGRCFHVCSATQGSRRTLGIGNRRECGIIKHAVLLLTLDRAIKQWTELLVCLDVANLSAVGALSLRGTKGFASKLRPGW
jgi:hypothetical protein